MISSERNYHQQLDDRDPFQTAHRFFLCVEHLGLLIVHEVPPIVELFEQLFNFVHVLIGLGEVFAPQQILGNFDAFFSCVVLVFECNVIVNKFCNHAVVS